MLGAEILLLLAIGACTGVLAGIFGIGGGFVLVPILTLTFNAQGVPPDTVLPLVIGTSLCTIIFTSMASTLGHYRQGNINPELAIPMIPAIVLGVVLGASIAPRLPAQLLGSLIGVYCFFAAWQMFYVTSGAGARKRSFVELGFVGTGVGVLSAMFGIGGGNLMVPYFNLIGCRPHRAIGTSAACGIPIAITATCVYALWPKAADSGLPETSIGFVDWKVALIIVLTSVPFANLAARLSRYIPAQILRRSFAGYLMLVGGFMIFRFWAS